VVDSVEGVIPALSNEALMSGNALVKEQEGAGLPGYRFDFLCLTLCLTLCFIWMAT
jgi:hypothetical protein